jgi:hypothetical protein
VTFWILPLISIPALSPTPLHNLCCQVAPLHQPGQAQAEQTKHQRTTMRSYLYSISGLFVCMAASGNAFTSSASRQTAPELRKRTSIFWGDGKNAAPAVLCEVENIPVLEPIPEG